MLVSVLLLAASSVLFTSQVLNRSQINAAFSQLTPPLASDFYRLLSGNSAKLVSYLLLLDVQLHDNQSGRHVNYAALDYSILADWLETSYALNPESHYPAFLASRVYSNVNDPDKIRTLIDVIERLFQKNPEINWRRMTEATLLAKHRLGDLRLALELAEQVAKLPGNVQMPYWARDMRIILLDELGELESARILISSLLQSGSVKDEDELRFLRQRLLKIQQSLSRPEQEAGF